jgi:pimeloyl-ACP methyl ester carboxylesterase
MNASKIPTVLLLHGYLRTGKDMNYLKGYFIKRGFNAIVPTLPVATAGIEKCSDILHEILSRKSWDILHLVGHSSGGRIIIDLLSRYDFPRTGNVVLVSTPVKGSVVAKRLSSLPYVGNISKTLSDLSLPTLNIPEGYKIGVIAAGTGMRLGLNPFISGDNDDLIAVSEMRFNGMHDFVFRKFWPHQMVHKNIQTANLIKNFLLAGCFESETNLQIRTSEQ